MCRFKCYVEWYFIYKRHRYSGRRALTSSGSGGSGVNYASPYSHWFGGLKAQYLIKASELTAAGISAGNISSVAFDVTSAGTAYTGFTIKAGATALNAITSTFITGLTQVYTVGDAGTTTPAVGLNAYAFGTGAGSSSFTWNGSSNIVIEVSWSNNNGGGSAAEVKYDNTSYVSLAQFHVDNGSVTTVRNTATASGTASLRPKMVIVGSTSITNTLNWSWNPGSLSGSTVIVNPLATTTYTVTATNPVTTCSKTATVSVTVNPIPADPSTQGSDQCGIAVPTASVQSNSGDASPIFRWYTVPTGGSPVQESTSITYTTAYL